MNQIVRPTVVLGAICIVCGGLLGVVESITREPIRIQEEAAAAEGMQKVAPEAASFEGIEIADDANYDGISVASANTALDASGETIGYVIEVLPNGFGGSIDMMVGVDLEGTVTGISILSLSESPGLGANAKEAWFQDQFVGHDSARCRRKGRRTGSGHNKLHNYFKSRIKRRQRSHQLGC